MKYKFNFTTIIGILIVIGFSIEIVKNGIELKDVLLGLTALGFIAAKDGSRSFKKSEILDPDKDEYPPKDTRGEILDPDKDEYPPKS